MANPEHVEILKQGVEVWNAWREDEPGFADLRDMTIRAEDLAGINLRASMLQNSSLVGIDMTDAQIYSSELANVNFSESDLTYVDFGGSNLSGANLSSTNLYQVNFDAAILHETVFSESICAWSSFGKVNLRTAVGLDTILHMGPSTIGIDTIYKSGGQIPDEFLRGCGVPDTFIDYIGSLVGKAIEFYSCFISYSSEDEDFAKRLHADLQDNGVRCWFAPHDIKAGEKLEEQIDRAIRLYEKLLVIVSENSMNSAWVETEIRKARKRERNEERRMLFPISLQGF